MAKKKKHAPRPAFGGSPKRHSRDRTLILIDQEPLRRDLLAECRKKMAAIEATRMEVRRFHQASAPAYAKWMAANFGELLTELRELSEACSEAEALIDEVLFSVATRGGSDHQAYVRVMRERERAKQAPVHSEHEQRPPEYADDPSPPSDEEHEREAFEDVVRLLFGFEPQSLSKKEYEKMYQDFREKVLGEEKQRERAKTKDREPSKDREVPQSRPETERPPTSRVKELYRALVRRLHPDLRADSDAEVSALWHEVQSAYQAQDEERLETLLALCDVQTDAVSSSTSFSQLRAVLKELKRTLNAIRRGRNELKQDPAWQFELKDPKQLRVKVERELRAEIADLREELAAMQEEIESWKRPAGKRGKKKRSSDDDYLGEELPF